MNLGMIIIIAVIGLWAVGAFLGAVGGFSKIFKPLVTSSDPSSVQSQEQHMIDDTEAKRQKMMDDIKQKIDDSNNKF